MWSVRYHYDHYVDHYDLNHHYDHYEHDYDYDDASE
jgi:hypothetical protein